MMDAKTNIKQLEQVREFHTTYNVPISDKIIIPTENRVNLRNSLIEEEIGELSFALIESTISDKDTEEVIDVLTEILDGAVDSLYVIYGTLLEFGLDKCFEEAFDEVQASNMSKLGLDGKPIYRVDGKVMKGPNFFKPKLREIIEKHLKKE